MEVLASLELISKSFPIQATAFLRESEEGREEEGKVEGKGGEKGERKREYKLKC